MKKILKYKTKQRENLLNYLKQNKKEHITAEQIIKHFKSIGNPIGKSTVYRYLDSLVCENIIRKYINQERGSACFQYIENNETCTNHYHMKCTKCGDLIHLNCEEISELQNHIFKEHGFELDICKTVLYGTCSKCLKKGDFV